jgi:uncharacterized membrane protein (DUF4010 family)
MLGSIVFQKIILSLAIGTLIGLEREKRAKGEMVAGIRTFMLVSLFGLLSGYVSEIFNNNLIILFAFISVGILDAIGYMSRVAKMKTLGMTTEIAFLLTFLIGLICYYESYPYFLTVTLGILLTFILVAKETLHGFVKHLEKKEIWDAIIFAIFAFIVLPILPTQPVDPFGALNLHTVWLAVVIVLSISFAGYVAMKLFGIKKGLALTGLFGGLASSTAVAISMAEKVKKDKRVLYSATFAVAVASSTMFLRQIAIVSFFDYTLAASLLLPFTLIGLIGYIFSCLIWKKSEKERETKIDIGSPLALKSAFLFAIFMAVILFITKLSQNFFTPETLYLIALVAGLVEVDAITISLATLMFSGVSTAVIMNGIIIASLSNTFSKWFLVSRLGTKKMSIEVGKVLGILILVGLAILLVFR